jgi:glycosyltransferase involved in cell wall biosynthesis
MRVGHFSNPGNMAYNAVRFLRRRGVTAELVMERGVFDHSRPEWEGDDISTVGTSPVDSDEKGQDHARNWIQYVPSLVGRAYAVRVRSAMNIQTARAVVRAMPEAMRTYGFSAPGVLIRFGLAQHYEARSRLAGLVLASKWVLASPLIVNLMRSYDVIHTYESSPMYARFSGKPYVIQPVGGDLTILPFTNTIAGRMQLEAYRRADVVLVSNLSILRVAKRIGIKRTEFIPVIVDTDKYVSHDSELRRILSEQYGADFVVLSPVRHSWAWKGNDRLIRAYSRLLGARPDSLLILSEWGEDLKASKELVRRLNIQDRVVFTPFLAKNELIEYYNAADVVADIFCEGCDFYGLTAAEAMSCSKPVVGHIAEDKYRTILSESPPILDALSEDQINDRLEWMANDDASRTSTGRRSREWVLKYHDGEKVAERLENIYRAIIRD